LFKPDALAAKHAWQGDPLLSSASKDAGFLSADWTAVPKVGFERVVIRQLEEQPSARVFDDSVGFELADYERRPPAPPQPKAATPGFTVDAKPTAISDSEAESDAVAAPSEVTGLAVADGGAEEAHPDVSMAPTPEPSPSVQSQNENDGQAAADTAQVDPAMLAQLCEQAFQEGLAQGLAQGHSQGLAQGQAEGEALGRAQGEAEGEARGVALGLQQAEQAQAPQMQALQEQMQAQLDPELALLREVTQRLQALVENPQELYEPLKRLALHVAEQLVLAELNLSGNAIERLVQRCLDELDLHGQGLVTIELNPQDKARLEEKAGDMVKNIQLHGVAQLKPGSVRVLANDTQVEDLVQTRLQALANSLLGQPEAWREQSSFFKQPLAQRDTEVTDAAPREVVDPRQVVDARHLGDIEHG
jgi:flagellar biosynthesis/type III secretory pathway protein FliH